MAKKNKIKEAERKVEREHNIEALRGEGFDDETIRLIYDLCKDSEPKFVVMFK